MSVDVQQQAAPAAVAGLRVDWAPVPKVNLLPQEILDARRFRTVQRALAGAVLAVVALAGGGYVWALHDASVAQAELDVTKARTAELRVEEAKYADVPRVVAQVEQATAARSRALGRDVLWYRFFDDLAAATPSSVALTTVSVAMDSAGTLPAAPDPLTPAGLGTVTFQGSGDRFPDVSAWLESVASIDGLDGSSLQSATRSAEDGGDGVTFASKIVIDGTALSHRYDGKAR